MSKTEPSRREFLRTTGAAAGAATVVAAPLVIAGDRVSGANDRIGVGFLGVGGRAQTHLGIINDFCKTGLAQPVAVCDVYRPRLEAASRTTGGTKMYMEHEALLADKNVDVVCIATPDRHHAPQAIDALNAGKDVLLRETADPLEPVRVGQEGPRGGRPQSAARAGGHPAHGRR